MNVNRLFDRLVDLTAIRDLELLEFSLLRTLHQYLSPLDLRIIRVNSDIEIKGEIVFGAERCIVKNEEAELDEEIKNILIKIEKTDSSEYTYENTSGFRSIYKIHKTHTTILYLMVLNHDRVTRENRHLLIGLLEIFRNYVGLLGENITDSLTGLLNRKSFDRTIDKIYDLVPDEDIEPVSDDERREASDSLYWLVMLDIDHFKKINDRFGHLYGDDVLILLAKIIKNCFRDDDLIFRFGGEEFVLIIKCANATGAKQALKRLLENVSSYLFPQVGTVTISAGAVCFKKNIFSATLLDYADQALYFSKRNGRNQVSFFEEMIEKGLTKEQEIKSGGVDLFEEEEGTEQIVALS
jgi:diguanylate cyclase (GGDEF)-like protein